MKRLYIDDIRDPKGEFDYIARSSNEAIEYLVRYGCPNYISFDHDLGEDDTALNIVKYMIELDLDSEGDFIPFDFDFNVHSANPVGKANIEGYLKAYLKSKTI
jgi:hypothetical protein